MSNFTGSPINMGSSVEYTLVAPVNTQQTMLVENSTATVFVRKIEYSNTQDFAVLVTPSAGELDIQWSTDGVTMYHMRGGNELKCGAPFSIVPSISGDINAVGILTYGVTGAAYVRLTFSCFFSFENSIDPRVYNGYQAFTVQSFTEANSKNGSQFEFSFKTSLAAGANNDAIIVTGDVPILVKERTIQFSTTSFVSRGYENPIYTGGTPVPYFNLNAWNPNPPTVTLISGATVTSPGTEIAAPVYGIGSAGVGSSVIATNFNRGGERVLAPNTTYLLRLTNDSGSTGVFATYTTWYEGEISVNL